MQRRSPRIEGMTESKIYMIHRCDFVFYYSREVSRSFCSVCDVIILEGFEIVDRVLQYYCFTYLPIVWPLEDKQSSQILGYFPY